MKDSIDQAFRTKSLSGVIPEPSYSGALSFARRKYTRDLANVDVVVTGFPFDTATTNRPGTRFGPRAIRAASVAVAWERNWPWEFDALEVLKVADYGDCQFDHGRPEGIPGQIQDHIEEILNTDTAVLSLGGDHFISLPILRAHVKKHGPVSLLHFDAHTDTWEDEEGRIDHGTMFYHAVREGLVNPEQSVQAGIRTTNDLEAVTRLLHPEVDQAMRVMSQYGEARMNGSGSSIFITCASRENAELIRRQLPDAENIVVVAAINDLASYRMLQELPQRES